MTDELKQMWCPGCEEWMLPQVSTEPHGAASITEQCAYCYTELVSESDMGVSDE